MFVCSGRALLHIDAHIYEEHPVASASASASAAACLWSMKSRNIIAKLDADPDPYLRL